MSTLRPDQLNRFCTDVAGLVRAGVPLPEGLRQLEHAFDDKMLKQVTALAAQATEQGQPLSHALRSSPVKFPEEYIALIECGEHTGEMASVLTYANQHSQMRRKHRNRVVMASLYPAFVVATGVVLLSVVTTFVVPLVRRNYEVLGAELPDMTQNLLWLLGPITGPLGMGFSILIAITVLSLVLTPSWWPRIHRILGVFPLVRDVQLLSDCAIAMRYMAVMLRSGVPEGPAVRSARLTVVDPEFSETLGLMADAAERGQPLNGHLPGVVPGMAAYIFQQGEQRGTLPEACDHIANVCADSFDRRSSRIALLLEPTLVLVVGLIVGGLIVGLYLPLFSLPKLVR